MYEFETQKITNRLLSKKNLIKQCDLLINHVLKTKN